LASLSFKQQIGAGAHGVVYEVFDHALGGRRALKLLRPDSFVDFDDFAKEARVLEELRHDHIVQVYEAGLGPNVGSTPDVGMFYILMEYLAGGSLAEIMLKKRVTQKTAIQYIIDTCMALEYVHIKGYLHRDIKPANILVSASGIAKLSDLGLATLTRRTRPGSGAGTMPYMAPETILTHQTNSITDVYALGATLYHVLNGANSLHWAGTDEAMAVAIKRGKFPDRNKFAPYVPDKIRRIVRKALHVNPTQRYQSAHQLRNALEGVPILVDWSERSTKNQESWMGVGNNTMLQVEIIERLKKPGFELVATQGHGIPVKMRRMTKLCSAHDDLTSAQEACSAIMQSLVCG